MFVAYSNENWRVAAEATPYKLLCLFGDEGRLMTLFFLCDIGDSATREVATLSLDRSIYFGLLIAAVCWRLDKKRICLGWV